MFNARRIISSIEFEQVYKMRNDVFVKELGWVDTNGYVETDAHDSHAVHFGVFDDKKLVAYLRAIEADHFSNFMIFHEFKSLLQEDIRSALLESESQHKSLSVEISRLFVKKELRDRNVTSLLFKELCRWAIEKKYVYLYCVMTKSLYEELISKYFIIMKIGEGRFNEQEDLCIVGYIDLLQTKKNLEHKDPKSFHWFFN